MKRGQRPLGPSTGVPPRQRIRKKGDVSPNAKSNAPTADKPMPGGKPKMGGMGAGTQTRSRSMNRQRSGAGTGGQAQTRSMKRQHPQGSPWQGQGGQQPQFDPQQMFQGLPPQFQDMIKQRMGQGGGFPGRGGK